MCGKCSENGGTSLIKLCLKNVILIFLLVWCSLCLENKTASSRESK